MVPSNGNLAFAQGMVEQFAAGDDLISLRSRTGAFRPLTVVREMEAEAQKQYFGKIQELEEELQKTTGQAAGAAEGARSGRQSRRRSSRPSSRPSSSASARRSPRRASQLKEVRKNLRQDAEGLVFWTKVANIALMPLLVALIGLLVALLASRRRRAV